MDYELIKKESKNKEEKEFTWTAALLSPPQVVWCALLLRRIQVWMVTARQAWPAW